MLIYGCSFTHLSNHLQLDRTLLPIKFTHDNLAINDKVHFQVCVHTHTTPHRELLIIF